MPSPVVYQISPVGDGLGDETGVCGGDKRDFDRLHVVVDLEDHRTCCGFALGELDLVLRSKLLCLALALGLVVAEDERRKMLL